MADDKGGSSKTWEPFEVVLVLLLAIGLLSKIQTKTTGQTTTSSEKTKTTVVNKTPDTSCGLTILHPHSLEKIHTEVPLSGSTVGCNWKSTDTIALYAQVIDANGKPVSDYVTVVPTEVVGDTTSFDTTIYLFDQPSSGKGYIILIPAVPSGDHSITYRIPVTFSSS